MKAIYGVELSFPLQFFDERAGRAHRPHGVGRRGADSD
jgi:hypothetical protein